mmetsp:Transcript_80952/g.177686  ORF Transcript_80952/g.177686 Transcript_80952/m.177686 type:complete len:211 (-) Transcript_80952:127-759(-)
MADQRSSQSSQHCFCSQQCLRRLSEHQLGCHLVVLATTCSKQRGVLVILGVEEFSSSRPSASSSSSSSAALLCRAAARPSQPLARVLAPRLLGGGQPRFSSISITFVKAEDNSELTVPAEPGQTILEVAFENNIDIEGACGGECACSTCHIVMSEEDYAKFDEPDEDEADMLDLAMNVTETSRLGCQIKLTKDNDGMRLTIPEGTVSFLS